MLLTQVEPEFEPHFAFIDQQIGLIDDDEIRGPLRQIRSEVNALLQEIRDVSELDQEQLKLYLCLYLPVVQLGGRDIERNKKVLVDAQVKELIGGKVDGTIEFREFLKSSVKIETA